MGYKDGRRGEKETTYIVCPLCARNRTLDTQSKGRLRWDFWDPETSPIVQIREAGGKLPSEQQPDREGKRKRGHAAAIGFPVKHALTWTDIVDDPEYADQVDEIRRQINKIHTALRKKKE